MAVGESQLSNLVPVAGVDLATISAGIKTPGRKDLVLIKLCEGTRVAGVFTKNAFCAAPVSLAKAHLAQADTRFFVINTGNANAGTGERGEQDALTTCEQLAVLAGVATESVLPFSTGVIGEPLPIDRITTALPHAVSELHRDGWLEAAEGILTTDTRPKGSSRTFMLAGAEITITGISKGAGMIKPNMATMLAFVATNLAIGQQQLQQLVTHAADCSFNRISVDGDTSTNDSAMLAATAKSGVAYECLSSDEQRQFQEHLDALFIDLAQQIVRDGEGATKFVSVVVDGGENTEACLKVGYTVAESPLVKTALFASDPNWGRILAAVGRAGLDNLDVTAVQVFLNDTLIVERGGRAVSYTEEAGQAVFDQQEIRIRICLNRGDYSETIWTTDLSHDYVSINADYRS